MRRQQLHVLVITIAALAVALTVVVTMARLLAEPALAGAQVTAVTLSSDHSFQDHRIALAGEVVAWLGQLLN